MWLSKPATAICTKMKDNKWKIYILVQLFLPHIPFLCMIMEQHKRAENYISSKINIQFGPIVLEKITTEGLNLVVVIPTLVAVSVCFVS